MRYFERLDTTWGIFAARMAFCADVMFCTWTFSTFCAACIWFTAAPIVPRNAAAFWIAVLTSVSAVWAEADEFKLSVARPAARALALNTPTLNEIVVLAVASLRKTLVVEAVNTEAPLNVV